MAVTGDKTSSIFRRYSIVDEEDLRAKIIRTQAYVDTLPTTWTAEPATASKLEGSFAMRISESRGPAGQRLTLASQVLWLWARLDRQAFWV
jgi:hypothetical protein